MGTRDIELQRRPDSVSIEKTEVVYGAENIVKLSIRNIANAKKRIDICGDKNLAWLHASTEVVLNEFMKAKKRGVRIRLVTEITKENLDYCKENMKFAELRHLDAIKGNFGIVDSHYQASANLQVNQKDRVTSLHSTDKEFVEQQRYLFESLWKKAIPADLRIKEIEEGLAPEKTEVVYGAENVLDFALKDLASRYKSIDICGDHDCPSITAENKPLLAKYKELFKRGVRFRIVTQITKENLRYCRKLLEFSELRHLEGLKGISGVADGKLFFSATYEQGDKVMPHMVASTVRVLVEQQQYFFETLWAKAIPAEQKIKEIEEGREQEFLQVVTDGNQASQIVLQFAKSVKREAQIVLPSASTMLRAAKLGMWDHLIAAAKKGARIRVISPISEANLALVKDICQQAPNITILNGETSSAGFFIRDNQVYFRAEIKDAKANDVASAIGFLEYSNSKSGIDAFKAFFDILWKQTMDYEKLKNYERMQTEFINIAAHELRTPIQPILGLAEVLRNVLTDTEGKMMSYIIVKNAKKLVELQENVLDVTRIESGSLKLRLEQVNLDNIINDIIRERKDKAREIGVELTCRSSNASVKADPQRIGQVISNLVDNALSFTSQGSIQISVEKSGSDVIVTVRDTGRGIDSDILPRLFEKFVTKSEKGTGLGLFISKSIIEAHGGRIWAENNKDGKGASFHFSLPVK